VEDVLPALSKLRGVVSQGGFGEPRELAAQALDAARQTDRLVEQLNRTTFDQRTLRKVLQNMCSRCAERYFDYESARRIAWACEVLYSDLGPAPPRAAEIGSLLAALQHELNLKPATSQKDRDTLVRTALTKQLPKEDVNDFDAAFREEPESLIRNRFLFALLTKFNEVRIREVFGNGPFLAEWAQITDTELDASLGRMRDYDPRRFQERLRDLATLLGS
jgi:hypothetical protein